MFRRKKVIKVAETGDMLLPKGVQIELPEGVRLLIQTDNDEAETLVGTVSKDTLAKYNENVEKRKALKILLDEVHDRIVEQNQERLSVWEEIYDELGLDPEKHYRIDEESGKIFHIEDKSEVEAKLMMGSE